MDARTDLFSSGAVLYEMATGRQAFSGTATAVVDDAIFHHEPTSSIEVNGNVRLTKQGAGCTMALVGLLMLANRRQACKE
jgi:hypothetical protein